MNESISTAAGAAHGQLAKPRELRELAKEVLQNQEMNYFSITCTHSTYTLIQTLKGWTGSISAHNSLSNSSRRL